MTNVDKLAMTGLSRRARYREIDMVNLPSRLKSALESDCASELNEVLQEKRQADLEKLIELVSTSPEVNPKHRTRAIYALGRWGNTAAVDKIIQVMPVLDEIGRITAIDSLGRLGSHKALQPIFEQSDDPSMHVRKFVIHALGRYKLAEARAKLVEMRENDPDPILRTLAAEYLDLDLPG
jgi:HEAT repeat protein